MRKGAVGKRVTRERPRRGCDGTRNETDRTLFESYRTFDLSLVKLSKEKQTIRWLDATNSFLELIEQLEIPFASSLHSVPDEKIRKRGMKLRNLRRNRLNSLQAIQSLKVLREV